MDYEKNAAQKTHYDPCWLQVKSVCMYVQTNRKKISRKQMKFKVILQKNILFSYFPHFLPYVCITLKKQSITILHTKSSEKNTTLGKFIKTHLRYNEGEKAGSCSVKRLFHHDGILMLPHIHMHSQRILKIILFYHFHLKKQNLRQNFISILQKSIYIQYMCYKYEWLEMDREKSTIVTISNGKLDKELWNF